MSDILHHLPCLYEIGQALARFESVESTFPVITALVARALPLRSLVFLATAGGQARTWVWQAEDESAQALELAVAHARRCYEYLTGSAAAAPNQAGPEATGRSPRAPERDGETSRLVALPLVVTRGRLLGTLQLEIGGLDEEDLFFVSAVIQEIAEALERKARDEALLLSETMLAGIISIAADAIISVDEEQRILIFNEGAVSTFGYSKEEVLGAPLSMLVPERFRAAHHEHVRGFAAERGPARKMGERGGIVGLRKGGEEFPAEATISRLVIGGRRVLTVVLRDVTERRRLERAREEVLAIVSHDLRTPLSAILTNVGTLLRTGRGEDQEQRRLLERVQRSITVMSQLIEDLLDANRLEAGRFSVAPESLSIEEVLTQVVDVLQPLLIQKSLSLVCEVSPDLPQVLADPTRVRQIFMNLLGNAIKFTPRGGTVAVRSEPLGDLLRFSVTDTGPGIPEAEVGHLFDRFWQAPGTAGLGTGLGLFIVKGIVEAHGGEIWAESEVGKGSSFLFTLPAARQAT
jgi:PAS domain S-box-containing protein